MPNEWVQGPFVPDFWYAVDLWKGAKCPDVVIVVLVRVQRVYVESNSVVQSFQTPSLQFVMLRVQK
jgi:hypothetical protein